MARRYEEPPAMALAEDVAYRAILVQEQTRTVDLTVWIQVL